MRHGEKLFYPPLDQVPTSIAGNIQRLGSWPNQLSGQDWQIVVKQGRSELLQLATEYTRQYCDVPNHSLANSAEVPWILSGHQPQLFHPGVWFKNFVLDRLAKQTGGVAINLIIDNDLAGPAAIRVPGGTAEDPRVETVPYDRSAAELPFEERGILDRAEFGGFADRVLQKLHSLVADPLITSWWPRAIDVARREPNLGRCIAQARHQLEAAWGLSTLEVPWSSVCETVTFRRFVLAWLHDLPRLQRVYNESLWDYRQVNRLRSRSHPVPELEHREDWLETPLWVWTGEDPRRRRLFARSRVGGTELTDWEGKRWQLAARVDDALVDLAELAKGGVKVRPRALLTTMYARLVLSDLFVHGIGGGKYDQLTDAIVRGWLKIDPPQFQVVTATAQLPIARHSVTSDELNRVERMLRDLTFNPDRHLAESGPASTLIAEKRHWLTMDPSALDPSGMDPSPGVGRQRHAAIARINAALQDHVQLRRAELQGERDRITECLRRDRMLGSREFAFCLFPERTLRALLLDNA